jgi:hypothetical protein
VNDMSQVIVPKSDQINADDLISGPTTITISEVRISGGQEQPVSIFFEGSQKAYRPCKSMSRVLVFGWGPDANKYAGRSLTLYRDPSVKWAGMEVGGIRISHLSHIERDFVIALTATKGSRKMHQVKLLVPQQTEDFAQKWADQYVAKVGAFGSLADLSAYANEKSGKLAELETARPELHQLCVRALDTRRDILAVGGAAFQGDPETDPEGRAEADMGEAHTEQELPAWVAQAQQFRDQIQIAQDKIALGAIDADFLKVRASLPDDAAADLDKLISQRRRELNGDAA